jgi:hypothetical protein
MIKFFRNIRQGLLTENKFSKYLLYAIGEIVLVVIGILIALSINNWNENIKQSKRENKIIEEIKKNIENNILIFHQTEKKQKETLHDLDLFLEAMKRESFKNDSINISFLLIPESISLASTGYESLKTIGFDLISSDELRTEIIQLFNVEYSQLNQAIDNILPVHNSVIIAPIIKKHFEVLSAPYARISDTELLKNDPEIINGLALRRVWKKVFIQLIEERQLKSKELLIKINTIINESESN